MDRDRDRDEQQGDRPSDTERLVGDTAASDRLTDRDRAEPAEEETHDEGEDRPNPPRTTTGRITAPKFGSAGSGGAELDPGYEKN